MDFKVIYVKLGLINVMINKLIIKKSSSKVKIIRKIYAYSMNFMKIKIIVLILELIAKEEIFKINTV
jgi:uncharacterized protein YybS (DUF2232 family)